MKFPKKQAQRLIPEYLLDYTTKLNESHPDPTESWGGGSTVIANPTLSGDEATLDGLEVDGTKYKVGGGSEVHLYRHIINETSIWCSIYILLKSNIPFTMSSLAQWLYGNGYNSMYNRYTASNSLEPVTSGVYSTDGVKIYYIEVSGQKEYKGSNFVDIISEVL